MRKRHGCWLVLAAVGCWSGCGKAERQEASTLYQALNQKKPDLTAIDALEKDLMGSTSAWCANILANGAGKGKDLTENATSAKQLAQSAGTVANQLSQVRQTIYDLPLKEDYPQQVRSTLINSIMKRQKMLQSVRSALDASAAGFLDFAQSRSYKGDSYPAAIDQLNTLVSHYHGPDNDVDKAIQDLKEKYTF